MSTTLTSKGQVTIPKAVREHLGLKPGSKVAFSLDANGDVVIKPAVERKGSPDRFERLRGHAGPGMSTDEIMKLLRGDDW